MPNDFVALGAYEVSITNVLGHRVWFGTKENNNIQLNVSDWNKGIYLCTITNKAGENTITNFVVQ